tara:strand:+ start:13346 stop:13918 length:573 start_codon:yes stop_codon:yes gene_type:complete
MSEENKAVQSEDNAVNNPTTEGSKNNVEQSVPLTRFSEVNNKMKAQSEELAELKSKEKERLEQEQIKAGEFQTVINDQKKQIEELTKVQNEWNTYQQDTRASLMDKLSDDKKVFGENMDLGTLQKFVESEMQSKPASAGKMNSQRQGVNPVGEFGGYSSYVEWATKDPIGYEKANGQVGLNNLGGTVRES